jgi:hypothetical protein
MVVEAEEPAPVLLVVTVVIAVLLLFVAGVTPEFVLVLMLLVLVLVPAEVFELLDEDMFVPAEAVFTGTCAEFVVGEAGVLVGVAVGAIEIELLELLAELL